MFKINEQPVGHDEKPYLIAEVGINARNDIELAKAHIDEASNSGADAVKFQTHLATEEMHQTEMDRIGAQDVFETIQSNQWTVEDHEVLKEHCQNRGVDFLSTPFSTAAVELLDDIDVPAIKIGSGELTNYELLDSAASTGKPLIISTGMASHDSIRRTYEFVAERANDVAYLYCVSEYPTQPEDIHISYIDNLRNEIGGPVGFSDHTIGIEASVLSLGYDISIIEKHFTIDRRLPGPDQSVSVTPEELARLREFIDYNEQTRGSDKPLTEEEDDVKTWATHSIVTTQEIAEGDALKPSNISTKRPGTGVPAELYFEILGSEAKNNLDAGTLLSEDDFTGL